VQKAGRQIHLATYSELLKQANDLGFTKVQFQAFGDDWLEAAGQILNLAPDVIVKIPATEPA